MNKPDFKEFTDNLHEISGELNKFMFNIHKDFSPLEMIGLMEMFRMTSETNLAEFKNTDEETVIFVQNLVRNSTKTTKVENGKEYQK